MLFEPGYISNMKLFGIDSELFNYFLDLYYFFRENGIILIGIHFVLKYNLFHIIDALGPLDYEFPALRAMSLLQLIHVLFIVYLSFRGISLNFREIQGLSDP